MSGASRSNLLAGRTPPHSAALAANRARRARKRRRDVFLALCCLAAGSLVLGLLPGLRAVLLFHVAVDAVLALYTLALLQRRMSYAAERAGVTSRSMEPRRYAAQSSPGGVYELGPAYALASGE